MANENRNPFLCKSALFVKEDPQGSTRVIKFLGCGAWRDLDLVDIRAFEGMEHRATWERVDLNIGDLGIAETQKMIGENCTRLCANCDRFQPDNWRLVNLKQLLGMEEERQGEIAYAPSYPSDPEYTPGPDILGGEATSAPEGIVAPIQT